MFTVCCLISTPSFLPANLTPSSLIEGRTPSSLDRISPLLIPILWSTTQVTTFTAALGGTVIYHDVSNGNASLRLQKPALQELLSHINGIFLWSFHSEITRITYAILLSTPLYISLHETKIRSRGKKKNWFVAILQTNKQKTWTQSTLNSFSSLKKCKFDKYKCNEIFCTTHTR